LGEAANSVGAQLACGTPAGANGGSGANGANARSMFEQARQAYVLMGVEPELDCANPQQVLAGLAQAKMVVLMSAFKHAPALDYADVMLPVAPYTETSGTFVNTEGRVQSFTGVVRPAGDTRPAWKVLRVLGNILSLEGFDYNTSEEVRDQVLGTDSEFVQGLDNGLKGIEVTLPVAGEGLERIADVPIHFTDPIVRRAPALQKTRDAATPQARMAAATLARLGLASGDSVKVSQGGGEVRLLAALDEGVPPGCVRVAAAHTSTAGLGDMFGSISVERA
ncbi:MAG: molybdopterin-dependent oxidoreductase, partial [Azovibrio sp.]